MGLTLRPAICNLISMLTDEEAVLGYACVLKNMIHLILLHNKIEYDMPQSVKLTIFIMKVSLRNNDAASILTLSRIAWIQRSERNSNTAKKILYGT